MSEKKFNQNLNEYINYTFPFKEQRIPHIRKFNLMAKLNGH